MWPVWWVVLFLHCEPARQSMTRKYSSVPSDRSLVMSATGDYVKTFQDGPCPSLIKHYNLREFENNAIKKLLTYGHNGLRNRLATKLDACDMLEMTWDDNLAELSNRHHVHCFQTVSGIKRPPLQASEDIWRDHHRAPASNGTDVARNSFFLPNIYARNFIEFAVANWYDSHTQLSPPSLITINRKEFLQVLGDNSFTHIIFPMAFRLGCSYAMFMNGLSLICYYFPYLSVNDTVMLRLKPKEYQCPYTFPILHPLFKRLCVYTE